jgi:prepilin peptidase CpaA
MIPYPLVSTWIFVLTSGVLFLVALTDSKEFKVPNELVAVLAALYVVHALLSGGWISIHWHVVFALLILSGGAYAYWIQQVGGGDLKLLSVAFLWTGPQFAAPFVVLLIMFTGLYYVAARLGFFVAQRTSSGLRIPLGPSLAAALISVLAMGLVTPGN